MKYSPLDRAVIALARAVEAGTDPVQLSPEHAFLLLRAVRQRRAKAILKRRLWAERRAKAAVDAAAAVLAAPVEGSSPSPLTEPPQGG